MVITKDILQKALDIFRYYTIECNRSFVVLFFTIYLGMTFLAPCRYKIAYLNYVVGKTLILVV